MRTTSRRLAPAALAAGLVGGTALGAVAFGAGGAFGTSADPALQAVQTDDSTTTAPAGTGSTSSAPEQDKGQWLADALAPLVANGTITQAQADAVTAAIQQAAPPRGGPRHGHVRVGVELDAAATAIGITSDELRTELRNGSTIAAVAQAHNVDVQTVIDAMVASATAKLDQEVAAGNITQARADEVKGELTAKVTAAVNGERPAFPGGGRHGPGGGTDTGGTPASTSTTTG